MKGFDLEAPSNLDVHAHTRAHSPLASLNPVLERLSHIPQGHVVNTVLTSNHHPCRTPSLSCSPVTQAISVLITYQWRRLFIKTLPVACGAKVFFLCSFSNNSLHKQAAVALKCIWLKGLKMCVCVHRNINGHLGAFISLQREELFCFDLNNGFKAGRLKGQILFSLYFLLTTSCIDLQSFGRRKSQESFQMPLNYQTPQGNPLSALYIP